MHGRTTLARSDVNVTTPPSARLPTESTSSEQPHDKATPRPGRAVTGYLRLGFLGGVTILVVGQVLAIAGILMPALFLPGVYVIGLGLLVLAVCGLVAAFADREPEVTPPARPRARGGA